VARQNVTPEPRKEVRKEGRKGRRERILSEVYYRRIEN
jgi:hypothetical protein